MRADGYAEETNKYTTLEEAINEFMKDMNISYKGLEFVPKMELIPYEKVRCECNKKGNMLQF